MLNRHSKEWREGLAELVSLLMPGVEDKRSQVCFDVISEVANAHGVTASELLAKDRARVACKARWHVFYTLHLLGYSTPYIGDVFDMDHTTVLYGIKRHKERLLRDTPTKDADVENQ